MKKIRRQPKFVITALNEKGETLPMTKQTRELIEKDEFMTVTLPKGLKLVNPKHRA
jgi:hypothetical protein